MTVVVDTDVLIDYLRAVPEAVEYLESENRGLSVSTISVAELYAGVREGAERQALEAFVTAFDRVPVDEAIAESGGLFRRDFHQSHGVTLADALIAATAVARASTLVTLNRKHFPMLADVQVPYSKS